jgi:broad specificity phosphatase PhoE
LSALSENRGLEVEIEKGFIDIDFGKWQGLSHVKVKEEDKSIYETWLAEPHKVVFPEGESLEDVCKRSMEALEKVIKNHPGETLAIVSHRVLNKYLVSGISNRIHVQLTDLNIKMGTITLL